MKTISFDIINPIISNINQKYVNKKLRVASMTDVCFVNKTQILCASFDSASIALYDLELDKLLLKYKCTGCDAFIDIMDYDPINKLIYTTHLRNYEIRTHLLYNSQITEINRIKTIGKPHGLKLIDGALYYTTLEGDLVRQTGNHHKIIFSTRGKIQLQDVTSINNVIYLSGTTTQVTSKSKKMPVESYIIDVNTKKYHKLVNRRFDGIDSYNKYIFACDQYNSEVIILDMSNGYPVLVATIKDMHFCHGCHYFNGKLAVALYGTNSVKIIDNIDNYFNINK